MKPHCFYHVYSHVDLISSPLLFSWQVDKKTVKTRAFKEACIYSVVDELAKHLAQWSYSIAFFEMSFIPLVRLRSFCKTIKADRFRKEMKDLIYQVCQACVGVRITVFEPFHIC